MTERAAHIDNELAGELVAMFDEDQALVRRFLAEADNYRTDFEHSHDLKLGTPWPYVLLEWEPVDQAPPIVQELVASVRHHTSRLREIVATRGWPGRSLVGEAGADAAWLLLQHAGSGVRSIGIPEHHEFQEACLPLLQTGVRRGDVHPRQLANIVDNIRWIRGEPPVYAALSYDYSVEKGKPVFRCPVSVGAIDGARAEIGLPPLADDVARRERGEVLMAAGPSRAEPWPDPPDAL